MSTKLPEIFYLQDVAQSDVFSNLVSDLKQDVWQFGVVTNNAAGFGVEDDAKFWFADMVKNRWNEVLFQDIIDKLEMLDPAIKNYNFKSLDVKAGGKTFGLDGNIHIDRDFEYNSKGDRYMTFCYFPNEEWHPEWGGELQFFDNDSNVIATYFPMPNTCIVFDSNIPHRGLAPTRDCKELRKYISFKTFVNKMVDDQE